MNGTQESFQLYKMDENVQITSGLEKKAPPSELKFPFRSLKINSKLLMFSRLI